MRQLMTAARWLSILTCSVGVFLSQAAAQETVKDELKPGEQVARKLEVKHEDQTTTVHYWLFVPKQYKESEPMPLMLFMHGAGERGDDLEKVAQWGPPKLVKERKDFPFIVISPQCPAEKWWQPDHMIQLVEHVIEELAVDKTRVYVTGLSMGGFGTWALLSEKPELFAAAAPICGGGDAKKVDKFKTMPIWVFHGDADRVVGVERSREMVEALKAAGAPVKYTEYEGVGHNSWSKTYANEELYQWLLEQRRSN